MRVQSAYIPSPTQSVWEIGPVPLRAYALCIIAGIALAIVISERRWVARGGRSGTVTDVAVWAVIFGLVGGRLYHVLTNPELYFGEGEEPIDAVKIWEGGLGIWGAIALGTVGAWIACRRKGVAFAPFADAAAPGIAVAQAVGRIGNWFNNELYGRVTDLPWGLTIYDFNGTNEARQINGQNVELGQFHPTFLYELLWNLGVALLLIWADRRFKMGRGRVFALYVMAYTLGRGWIETLRDFDDAHEFFGIRLNVYTSVVVFLAGLAWFVTHRGPREKVVEAGVGEQPPDDEGTAEPESGTEESEESEESEEKAGSDDPDTKVTAEADDAGSGDEPEAEPAEQPAADEPEKAGTERSSDSTKAGAEGG